MCKCRTLGAVSAHAWLVGARRSLPQPIFCHTETETILAEQYCQGLLGTLERHALYAVSIPINPVAMYSTTPRHVVHSNYTVYTLHVVQRNHQTQHCSDQPGKSSVQQRHVHYHMLHSTAYGVTRTRFVNAHHEAGSAINPASCYLKAEALPQTECAQA